jgi:anti-sigma regulatory factor (Ser/Thr protein kinase)
MPAGDRPGGGASDDPLTGGPDPTASATTMVSPLDFPGIPADAARLVGVRRTLQDWALAAGLPHTTAADLVLAAYEAMANSAEHAYRNRSGTIDLLATCDDDEVVVTVRDRGDWRPPPADPGHRGRGLMMIRSMSQAEVEPGPHGTTVRMRWPRR